MKKWIITVGLIFLVLGIQVCNIANASDSFPELSAVAVAVYDADLDLILYEKNIHQQRSIASLTKIMTILYACELIEAGQISMEDIVTASDKAASRGGTEIKLAGGDQFTVEELLYASALASANDAAVALAEYIAGSEEEYAQLMTNRAWELGLSNTNFVDATGLLSIYSGNYSTAYEMAKLSQFALANSLFQSIVSTKEYELKPQNRTIRNSNVLLHDVEGVTGIKTGATTTAGHTLITSAERYGRCLITVVLGAPSREVRNSQSKDLLEYAYKQLEVFIPEGEVVCQIEVRDGVEHLIDAVLAQEFSLFMFNNDDDIDTETHLFDVTAPVEKGDVVGEMIVLRNGSEYVSIDLVANHSTGIVSIFKRIWNRIVEFLQNLFIGG